MQITDPTVISHKEMTLETLMTTVDEIDGDFIVAYSLNPDGSCSDDVLVLETDVYSDVFDEFLYFNGRKYNWEVDVFSLKSITKYGDTSPGRASIEKLVNDAKYFLLNRAYLPVPE